MNRLLLLCLLASVDVCAEGFPPLFKTAPNPFDFSPVLIDTISPTIQCPPSDTIVLGTGKCDTAYNFTIVANDDQPNFILIQLSGLASGSSFQSGTTINSYLVTDLVGNTATCSFTVTVVEAGNNTLVCKDVIEIALEQNCAAEVAPEDLLEVPYGCTEGDVVSIDKTPPLGNGPWVPANLGIDDLGKTYAVRVVDGATGNSCWGSLKVTDPAPTIQCSNLNVHCAVDNLTPAFLYDSLGFAAGLPVISDNCPGYTVTYVDIAENLPCNPLSSISGTVNRFWTVTDTSGNKAACQQTIVRQRSFTDIQFPPNDTASCTERNNFDLTGTPVLQVGDYRFSLWPTSYCEFEIQYSDTLETAFCSGGGRYIRTWKIFDLCQPLSPDNPLTGQQTIDFVDETGPVLTCDSLITVVAEATDCFVELDLPDVVFSDDCSQIAAVLAWWSVGDHQDSLTGTVAPSDTLGILGTKTDFPAGITTVTYEVTDDCGNTGTCETVISVWDTDPPVADCISFFTVTLDADGEFSLGADTLDQNSGDSCSQILSFKIRRTLPSAACSPTAQFDDSVPFCCSDIDDTIELTRRVYDVTVPGGPVSDTFALGQFSDCIIKVAVFDTLPLACIAPPFVEFGCTEFDLETSDFGVPVYNCLVDSSAVSIDLILYDSSCSEGLITRKFQVFDKNGNSAECFQQIVVNHEQDYYIKFPNDAIVTFCDGTNYYGEPEFSQNGCEDLIVTFEDEIFTIVPDACFKIERTWTIRNRCTYDSALAVILVPNPTPVNPPNDPDNLPGPVVSPPGTPAPWAPTSVKVAFLDTAPSDYSEFWAADANAYQYKQIIKIIDTQKPVIDDCPAGPVAMGDSTANDSLLWNQTYWWDPATDRHDLCEGSTPLSIVSGDACSGTTINVRFLLFLNLDGDNTQETVISSNNLPAPGTVNFNNFSIPNYTGGTPRVFDGRPVLTHQIYRWALHQSVDSNQLTTSIQWKTLAQMPTNDAPFGLPGIAPQLPHGTHKIRWFVTDGCGNETTCDYTFTVEDTKAPSVVCKDTSPVEIPATGSVSVFAADLVQSGEDNCTPAPLLQYAVRKAGAGTGFPLDSLGNQQDSVTFNCADQGVKTVELWAKDLAGNTAFCTADITLTDADSSCSLSLLSIAGNVFVSNTSLALAATHAFAQPVNLTDQSDAIGDFEFAKSVPSGSNYMLTPLNDDNHLNGVSTFDLVTISKHILGLETLGTPYHIISADANHSNTVTTFDIVEIRKLILGIYTEFPDNTSWRFVDADYVFPDPANPFQPGFPEKITRTTIMTDQPDDNFIAMKTGDVNGSALPDNVTAPDERGQSVLWLNVKNRSVEKGEQFSVAFQASTPVLGYQFTLNTNGLEVADILPGANMTSSHFGVFEDAVTAAVETGAGEFTIVFRALKPGKLSDLLSISSRITRAEAYKAIQDGRVNDLSDVALRFDDGAVSHPEFELYQNRPNPFRDKTEIGFNLPEASEVTLTIFDETGRVLFTQSGQYARGYHAVSMAQHLLDGAGVLYYKLATPTESDVKKMVLVK